MDKKNIWLRISYWSGAIVDALAAILLTFPGLMSFFYKVGPVNLDPAFRTADGSAAGLMWGWTFLLIWADRKPFERRGILFLTLVPVLAMMIFYRFIDVLIFRTPIIDQIPFFILQFSLVTLLSYSLWINRKVSH